MELRRSHFFERLQKRGVGARATGIVQLPGASELLQPLHHAPDRRDADAACEQNDMLGALHQREIVAGCADLERLSDAQLVVHAARAAATGWVALDRDAVALGIRFVLDQRILPDQAIGQVQIDMSAGLVSRQWLAVERCELVDVGVAGGIPDRSQAHLDEAVCRRGLRRRGFGRTGRHCVHRRFSCRVESVIGRQTRSSERRSLYMPDRGS